MHYFKAISEFKLELKSGNDQFRSKFAIFLSRETLKFDGWPWKIIGHLSYATSSFVHHFVAIGQFRLELQSGNAQFRSRSVIFPGVTLIFDEWPWKTTGISCMLLQGVCASFDSHRSIQTGVTVRKCQIRVKIGNFFPCYLGIWRMTLKTIGHLFYATSNFLHHFLAICELKLELRPGNAQFGSKSVIFFPVWPWNLIDDLEKQ